MKEQFNDFYKVIKVIKSCKTRDQLCVAKKYSGLFKIKHDISCGWSDMGSEIYLTINTQEIIIDTLERFRLKEKEC